MSMRDGIDERVKVKCRQVWVFCLDVDNRGGVVPWQVHIIWQGIVEVREGDAVLCSYWLTDYDLVDVIEFIPVLISDQLLVLHQRLKFWPPRNGQVECFGCEERLQVKQVEIIVIN